MVIEAAGMYSYIHSDFVITKRLGQLSVTRTVSSKNCLGWTQAFTQLYDQSTPATGLRPPLGLYNHRTEQVRPSHKFQC